MTILMTARLRLEPFDDAHFDALHAMNSLPEVMRYITGRPETPDETRASIARCKARWAEWGYSWWCMFARDSGQLVGAGCIQHLGRDAANPLEIGWRLRPEQQGKGYAQEAAQEMARFAFENLQAPLLYAVCDQNNPASAKIMRRLGMTYRGIERWYDTDTLAYSMTRADWLALA